MNPSRLTPNNVLAVVNAEPMTESVSRCQAARERHCRRYDIDHGPNDVVCLCADSSERDSGVGRDLINLAVDVVAADQGTGRIDRALTREERETSRSTTVMWW